MDNLTTIISEMIENELEGILLDVNNHMLDRLSNKIINEVRNSVCEALLSDNAVLFEVSTSVFRAQIKGNNHVEIAKASLAAAVEEIRGG